MNALRKSETNSRDPAPITISEEKKRCLRNMRISLRQLLSRGGFTPQIKFNASCSSTITEDAPTIRIAMLRAVAMPPVPGLWEL
jgi:hypothetical protein